MDIEYLLYLQQFRETVGSILTPLMNAVTKLSAGFLPIAMMCMIYWAFDRKAGRKILAGLGGGLFINGFLKLTFCVYRPWIRDTRILPYGDSKTAATGYSFPSGHTTRATAMFGGSGLWFMKKRHSVVAGLLFVLVFMTMFSRNYLGVHTPQDVLVGFISTAVSCKNSNTSYLFINIRREFVTLYEEKIIFIWRSLMQSVRDQIQ